MRAVIEALQSLGGVALVTTVTIAAEVGELSRFVKPRQIDGSHSVATPAEMRTVELDANRLWRYSQSSLR